MSLIGINEVGIFSTQRDVYPLIDPAPFYKEKTFAGKVVIITGGSQGIGGTTAAFYARSGAHLVLVGRSQAKLDQRKAEIEKEVPGAKIVLVSGDAADLQTAKKTVAEAVKAFGRVDILIANAAISMKIGQPIHVKDPLQWWNVQETNVRGVFNFFHATIPELLKTKGQVIVTTSAAAHIRIPTLSDYTLSKHTVDRLVELTALEYPDLKFYVVHPGNIDTEGNRSVGLTNSNTKWDTLELPAATYLWLTARKAEFLNGRYVQATWDLNEVIAVKDEIVEKNLLVTKLAGPTKA